MSRYICDGHEYRVVNTSHEGFNVYNVINNYGLHVATLWRSVDMDHWRVRLELDGQTIADIHEDDAIDNLLEPWAIQRYVNWATDNDTIENH